MPAGDVPFNGFSATAAPEPVPIVIYTITNTPGLLASGTNVLAVQAFNRSLDSSDLGFMAALDATTDDVAPSVLSLIPPANAALRSLTQVEVRFSDPVTNVDPA